jgi:hypothetical protein
MTDVVKIEININAPNEILILFDRLRKNWNVSVDPWSLLVSHFIQSALHGPILEGANCGSYNSQESYPNSRVGRSAGKRSWGFSFSRWARRS